MRWLRESVDDSPIAGGDRMLDTRLIGGAVFVSGDNPFAHMLHFTHWDTHFFKGSSEKSTHAAQLLLQTTVLINTYKKDKIAVTETSLSMLLGVVHTCAFKWSVSLFVCVV